ncbi:Fe-S cluster assembly ATPase SufC [Spiroplasma endosymbiont of Amphibalanus improvisus]|uniref:Fe-S cluster assembly ATPase SufC n=1 Tax=Spiroplasma endosymbiont of Amphibalanus improvisus TaxID=3066327 RepID=UPI00313E5D2F
MNKLEIKNLFVEVEDQLILKGVNLIIKEGEIHSLMGPNGNGKSTLLMTVMGHPDYKIIKGDILIDNQSILELSVDQRSRKGLFLALQNPVEINGLVNLDFLKTSLNNHREEKINLVEFYNLINGYLKELKMSPDMIKRYLNTGFSGGEKKRNEILQMKLIQPRISLIDEIDSGLDVDSLKIIAEEINKLVKKNNMATLIVSHYDRFYSLVKPTHVHILIDGYVVMNGGYELVDKINENGYEWIEKKKILERVNDKRISALGCGIKKVIKDN